MKKFPQPLIRPSKIRKLHVLRLKRDYFSDALINTCAKFKYFKINVVYNFLIAKLLTCLQFAIF